MSVPEDIRAVERPTGTVVCDGRNGVYPVREKLSGGYWVDSDGKRHRPSRNGKVVGHIVGLSYVPKETGDAGSVSCGDVDLKDWGNIELFDRLNRDLLDLLKMYYNGEDSARLYSAAVLRASYEGIPDRKLKRQYEESFLSEMFPGVNFGRSSFSEFLRNVGRSCSRITQFMRMMVGRLSPDDRIIIDGSLRQDHSRINSLSEISRKTSAHKHKDILLMYAYSQEKKQPVCSKVYPGNMVDQRAVCDFIGEFAISDGLIVADKGFPPESVRSAASEHEGLHYLLPLKRNRSEITDLNLLKFDSRLETDAGVQCTRKSSETEHGILWYYSYRDPAVAADEELLYMSGHRGKDFDAGDLEEKRMSFGTLVFESDTEMECGEVYEIYCNRWLIELFFRSQEDAMEMDTTREHSDYTVIAGNFIDYLASVMCARMLIYLDNRKLLDKNTYGDIMDLLLRVKMTRTSGDSEWRVRKIALTDAELVEKTGILQHPVIPSEKKKKGRPKGSKDGVRRKRRTKAEMEAAKVRN